MTGTEPVSTNLINALSLIRTCRPTCTNSIRRSAIKRRTNRGPVFEQLTRLVHGKKAIHTVVTSHPLTVEVTRHHAAPSIPIGPSISVPSETNSRAWSAARIDTQSEELSR